MFGVGLTGGVGSGKSTIAAMLQQAGAGVVDADSISHRLTQPGGPAIKALRARFGAEAIALDGSLDRASMRQRAFADKRVRQELEAVLHPMIRQAMQDLAKQLSAAGCPYVVSVVPLLVETGGWRALDRVLLVDCSEATQLSRVRMRPGMSDDGARAILAAQASREQRLAVADDVVVNEAALADIQCRVERLHRAYLRLGSRGA